MRKGFLMKNTVQIILGAIFLLFVMICPLPAMFAIPGLVWRILIGALSGFSLASGIYKTVYKR